MAEHFILPRWREPALAFDGELLVEVSSRLPDSNRWQEIRVYHTESNKYVTEVIGKSRIAGEHDIINTKVWRRLDQVHKGLLRKDDDREFYTDLALEALELLGIDVDNLTEHI